MSLFAIVPEANLYNTFSRVIGLHFFLELVRFIIVRDIHVIIPDLILLKNETLIWAQFRHLTTKLPILDQNTLNKFAVNPSHPVL